MDCYDFELDLPPEFCHYQDNGCEFGDSCLDCPFPECLYAEPGGKQRWLKCLRDGAVLRLFTSRGKTIKDLALMFGVSRRTIQRILKRAKDVSTPNSRFQRGADG
ncbi:MAG: helix-turn-helix domain-containing protein [Deltaproteobacteria bacterium]|nr:helix-turn-helix domain-containing protein [Deltaproteobacteria bacterium]